MTDMVVTAVRETAPWWLRLFGVSRQVADGYFVYRTPSDAAHRGLLQYNAHYRAVQDDEGVTHFIRFEDLALD
jgi:hypothetical protein